MALKAFIPRCLYWNDHVGAKQQEHRGLFQHKPCIHNDLNVLERLEQPKTLIPIPAHTHSPIMKTETNTNPEPNTTPPATWWTPQGFVIQDTPAAFLAVLEIPNGIWGEILKAAGYKHFADSGGEFSELQIGIYEHQSRDHFYVEVSNWDHGLSEFFVSKHDEDIFFVT